MLKKVREIKTNYNGNTAQLIALFTKTRNFAMACKVSGVKEHIAHYILLKNDLLVANQEPDFNSIYSELGREGEKLFQKLVPKAIDVNKYWGWNYSGYDFFYKGLRIDVKYASLSDKAPFSKTNKRGWIIVYRNDHDLVVAFLEKEIGKGLQDPYILIIPKNLHVTKSNKCIFENSLFVEKFKVKRKELKKYLNRYSRLISNE